MFQFDSRKGISIFIKYDDLLYIDDQTAANSHSRQALKWSDLANKTKLNTILYQDNNSSNNHQKLKQKYTSLSLSYISQLH